MCKRSGPVRVRLCKYPLLLLLVKLAEFCLTQFPMLTHGIKLVTRFKHAGPSPCVSAEYKQEPKTRVTVYHYGELEMLVTGSMGNIFVTCNNQMKCV